MVGGEAGGGAEDVREVAAEAGGGGGGAEVFGLYAFSKGSIDPTLLGIPMSVDFLSMLLLGGIQSVLGPIAGAAAFHAVKDFFMPLTDHWRLFLGLSIIAMVLVFPRGLAGAWASLRRQPA